MERFQKPRVAPTSERVAAMIVQSRRRIHIAIVLALTTFGITAYTPVRAGAIPRITGLYSDLAFKEGGGDLIGMEVFVAAGPGGYHATVQCAGGEPGTPIVTRVRVSGERVSFTLPPGQPECGTEFSGVISVAGLRGGFAGEDAQRWLRRKQSYWQ